MAEDELARLDQLAEEWRQSVIMGRARRTAGTQFLAGIVRCTSQLEAALREIRAGRATPSA